MNRILFTHILKVNNNKTLSLALTVHRVPDKLCCSFLTYFIVRDRRFS